MVNDPYMQQLAAQLMAQNKANSAGTNFLNSIPLGAAKRVLGAGELGLNGAQVLAKALNMPITGIQGMKNDIALGQQQADMEGRGTGAAGFVGEAAGDPTSYIPSPFTIAKGAPALAKIMAMGGHGAINGAVSGVTNGTQDPNSNIGNNVVNGVVGAGAGAGVGVGVPTALSAGGKVLKTGAGLGLRVASALGSQGASNTVARNILAKQLLADHISPSDISGNVNNSNSLGLGATLGESTQSPTVLQTEKQLVKGTGAAAKIMRDGLEQRNTVQIPGVIQSHIDDLQANGPEASKLYGASQQESQNTLNAANGAVQGTGNPNIPMSVAAPLNNAHAVLGQIQDTANARLGQMGDVNNPESQTLNQTNSIVRNAQKRLANISQTGENYFQIMQDAKNQLGKVYIPNADTTVQKQAQGYVAGFSKNIDQAMGALAPQNYTAAKSAAMLNMAGNDLDTALGASKVGGSGQIYNKMFSTPDLQDNLTRKLTLPDGTPDAASQDYYSNLFGELKNVAKGHGGSDTAFNMPAATNLDNDVLGGNPDFLDVLHTAPDVARTVGRLYSPQVYSSLAQQTLTPDAAALTKAMANRTATALNNPVVQNAIAPLSSMSATNATTPVQNTPDNPYMSLIPANNPYMSLIGQ